MAVIEIDGEKYEVEEGKNLLDACLTLGLDLPYFCWHPSLGSVGSCRQCAVKVYANPEDERGRILMGCMTPVTDGMRLSLKEKTVEDFRDQSIEVTMANHPHDCPVCEEGGECHLQDMTILSNHTERKYQGAKKTYNNQYLGPCISHEMNRCITCYRCVRFYDDYAGGKDLVALASRENTYFGRHEEGCLDSIFSGNLVEVCPTGVFTDKTLARSYNRKWDLQSAPSICTGCSLGCNISPGERAGKIKRIINRYHGQINGYFICDKGRFGYDHNNHPDRIASGYIRHENETYCVDYKKALDEASKQITKNGLSNLLGIGSERASVEENFLLKQLVGDANFYSGVNASRQSILDEITSIYESQSVQIASLKEIEQCDAVLILGEDLSHSAPRMALSVRQSTRQKSFAMANQSRIPLWQDASVRILAQNERSPLIIASVTGSDLDEIASESLNLSPSDIAKLGFEIAHNIDASCSAVEGNKELDNKLSNNELSNKAKEIAEVLKVAKNPIIISGASLNSLQLVKAAGQIAQALPNKTKVSFVLPDHNSMGVSLLGGKTLDALITQVRQSPGVYSLLVLQNDLYKHTDKYQIDLLLESCQSLIVIDHIQNRTTQQAHVIVPAKKVVETEGTIVNNEGRAQRYFEIHAVENPNINDNWKTLVNLSQALPSDENNQTSDLKHIESFDDIVNLLTEQGGYFSPWKDIAPSADFRIAGMKMPRQMHRYSGRTSLKAHEAVSERKQPVDDDSPLSFSMEGAPIQRPPEVNALIWSPGWNSNEAINKFQDEIAGPLTGGDPGVKLLNNSNKDISHSFDSEPTEDLLAVSHARIFDNCEMAYLSSALAQRVQKRCLLLNNETAEKYSLKNGEKATLKVGDNSIDMEVEISDSVPKGIVSVPDDIFTRENIPAAILPGAADLINRN